MAGWRRYMNIEEKIKKNNIETSDPGLKIPMRRQKSEVVTEEINYDAVKTSSKNLSQSKKLDAIDVGLSPEQQNLPVLNWRCRIMQVDV